MKFLIFLSDIFHFYKNKFVAKITHKKRVKQSLGEIEKIMQDSTLNSKKCDILQSMQNPQDSTKNRVLIVEPNTFHTETINGVAAAFQSLDYEVDILMRSEIKELGVDFGNFRVFYADLSDLLNALNSETMATYDFVFFNTMLLSICEHIHILRLAQPKTQILGLYHTISDITRFGDFENYKDGRYFALRDINYKGLSLKALNCPFIAPNISTKPQNSHITCISIGFQIYHRAFREIVSEILSKNLQVKFILVGRNEINLKCDFGERLVVLTNPSNEILLHTLLSSHYIFSHYSTFAHRQYLETSTSGQRQLSLGLNIPNVINEPFGAAFGFDNQNAVIYKNPLDGINRAVEIAKSAEYATLKQNLKMLNENINNESLENLKNAINRIQQGRGE